MANIMDYMDWRGDLSFLQAPFNEVDSLILAQLSYVDFKHIVSSVQSGRYITVKDAAERFFKVYNRGELLSQVSLSKKPALVLDKMAKCDRFSNCRLFRYVNQISYKENKQFSAISIGLDDGSVYVAYRGTDDTIAGWKENFSMSFLSPVPAQTEAVRYLEETAKYTWNGIRTGGHSKGGNLAVYAAVNCSPDVKERILEVHNYDGPGFDKGMIESEEYLSIRTKIKTFVPQSSVVGMLLEHEEEYSVVRSNQSGIRQHDALSWEVMRNQFFYVDNIAPKSKFLDVSLRAWVNRLEKTEREQFVEALFYVFDQIEVRNIGQLAQNGWKKTGEIIRTVGNMAPENKEVLTKTFRLLLDESRSVWKTWNKSTE